MMKPWSGSGRRRGILLFASCSVPLLFIALTTSFFYPHYFDTSFLSRKPAQTSLATKPDTTDSIRPWEPTHTSTGPHQTASTQPKGIVQLPAGWVFDIKRDERHYGLSEAQCDAAFPDFYKEIDRAVAFREEKGLGNIREEDVDIEWRQEGEIIRIMLYDRQVRFTSQAT